MTQCSPCDRPARSRAHARSLKSLGKVAGSPARLWDEAADRLARRLNVLKIDDVPAELEPVVQQVRPHAAAATVQSATHG